MKFRVRARFEGATTIRQSPLDVSWPPYLLRFEAAPCGRISAVSVERPVEDYLPLLPVLRHPDAKTDSLTYPPNPFHEELIGLLQYLESVGGFWCGVRRIVWDRAEFDWVPESDAERDQLVVWDLRIEQKYGEDVTEIDEKYIQVLLHRRPWHEHLTVPLAFYREGRNEFQQFRYVQAFVNFYFMIEGLFGGGGPNYRVRERFKASPTLVKAATEAANSLCDLPRHWEALRVLAPSKVVSTDAQTVLDLLVHFRGVLHHYSVKSSQSQGHPHNQRQFEAVAFLAMAVCVKLMPLLIVGRTSPDDVAR